MAAVDGGHKEIVEKLLSVCADNNFIHFENSVCVIYD